MSRVATKRPGDGTTNAIVRSLTPPRPAGRYLVAATRSSRPSLDRVATQRGRSSLSE